MYKLQEKDLVAHEALEILPKPRGYRMLIAMPKVDDKSQGGVYLDPNYVKLEETASIVGLVVAMGDLCYKDATRFPTGSWCEEGSWVMFRSYTGTRFKVNGTEYRIINDDSVEAVVDDPREIRRAF